MASILAPVLCARCKTLYVLTFSHYGRQTVRSPRGHSFTVQLNRR